MSHLPRRAFLLALLATSVLSCRATSNELPKPSYVFVFLVSGPNSGSKTPEENQKIMAGHLANIGRLADEGKLLIAGPFAKPVPDDKLRGIFILDTPDVETARAWTNTDPGVQAGVFAVELAHFRIMHPCAARSSSTVPRRRSSRRAGRSRRWVKGSGAMR